MAFKRENIENSYSKTGQTSSPLDNEKSVVDFEESRTSDSLEVTQKYNSDSKSSSGKVNTGAFIPQDMTVKLVRADSSNWEIFLSSLYAITLTLFGIFLGVWISDVQQEINNFSILEKIATLFFLGLSILLITVWIIIKVNQRKGGVKIPQNLLDTFGK
ncbi:MAG: hypothetical protein JXL97_05915 [Bacteroidales bacterium]|nr:hypothetical protein [Bacteroidales bacterium]